MNKPSTKFYENLPGRIGICLLIGLMVWLLQRPFLAIENEMEDVQKSAIAERQEASKDIVVITIDDKSLQALSKQINRYPWPRGIYECIVDYCSQAKAISFDLLLNEAENKNEFTIQDGAFIDAVSKSQNVISAVHLLPNVINKDSIDLLQPFEYTNDFTGLELEAYHSALAPYGRLLESTKGIGFVNVTYEAKGDSVQRRYRLLSEIDGHVYPSLALATAVQYLGLDATDVSLDNNKHVLHIGDQKMNLEEDASYHYRAYKSPKEGYSYKHYPFIDIIRAWTFEGTDQAPKGLSRELFKDKVVFLGSFATGLFHDEVNTPTNAKLPGVMLHAIVTDNLLHGHAFTVCSTFWIALIILVACLIPPLLNFQRPLYNFYHVVGVLLFYLSIVGGANLFAHLMPITSPIAALVLSTFFVGLVNWNKEREERSKLQDIELAKQQFTDMLVHDLRGRVATMTTSLEILGSMTTEEPLEQTPIYRTLKTSTQRLLGEVTSLLDIRRIEEGRMPIERQPLSINTTVEIAVRDYEMAAELLSLNFKEEYTADPSRFIHLDQDILRRILGNLVWNALQYGRRETDLLIRTESDDEGVRVSVANRGRSIPGESQDSIFQPFVAENVEKNLVNVSTGLGLTFCKLGTEAHHGTIELESPWADHGDGVKITMFFPWKGNESADLPPLILT